MTRKNAQSGFTLVEVTIAAVIGSFIAVVAVGALRTASAARDRVEQHLSVSDELRFATNLIRKDLQNLYRDNDYGRMRFIGTIAEDGDHVSTRLNIKAVSDVKARPQEKESDVYVIEYFLMQEEEKSYLMRRYCPVVGHEEIESTQGGILMPIAESIIGFDVQYFDGSEWVLEWPETEETLPGLVEVTLTAAASDSEDEDDVLASGFIVNFPRFATSSTDGSQTQTGEQQQGQQQQDQQDNNQNAGQNPGGGSGGGQPYQQRGGSGGGGRGSGGGQQDGSRNSGQNRGGRGSDSQQPGRGGRGR